MQYRGLGSVQIVLDGEPVGGIYAVYDAFQRIACKACSWPVDMHRASFGPSIGHLAVYLWSYFAPTPLPQAGQLILA